MSTNLFYLLANHDYSPLALIYSDFHRLLPVASYQGYKYWITFINDFAHLRTVYLLKTKS